MRFIKNLVSGLVVLVVILIAVLVSIPLFYSIDNLRPRIETEVNKHLRGHVELGQLSLSMFPEVRVRIEGVKATAPAPYDQEPLANVDSVSIKMPLVSFLTGPQATIVVDKPELLMISKGTESNVTAFLPPAPTTKAETPQAKAAAAKSVDETLQGLPPWIATRVREARLSFEIKDGNVVMRDLAALHRGDKTELHALNVSIANMNLSSPVALKVSVTPDVVSGDMHVLGPITTSGTVTVNPQGAGYQVALDVEEDLTALDAKMAALFHKKAGVPLKAGVKGTVTQADTITVDLSDLEFRFGGFKLGGKVKLTDAANPEKAGVTAALKSGETNIGPFGAIAPVIADYKLDGKFALSLAAMGPAKDPTVNVEIRLADVTGATPQLKHAVSGLTGKIIVQGTAKNPSVKIDPLSMRIASSDITVRADTKGVENIIANVAVTSNRLNVDELMGLETLKIDAPTEKKPKNAPIIPLDQSLNQMAPTLEQQLENPMLDKITATVALNLKSVKAVGAEFTNATLNLGYAKRQLRISKTGLGGYGGRVEISGEMGLNPKAPSFDFKTGLKDVKIGEVTRVHAPSWNGMLTGTMTGDAAVSGRGLRKEQLDEKLAGSLKADIRDGNLNLPIVKLVQMVINAVPQKFQAKALSASEGKEYHGQFKTMKLASTVKGRVVELQDIDVVYDTLQEKIGDMRFQAKGTVNFDQQVDITGVAYLSAAAIPVPELKAPSGKIEIPLKFTGPIANPNPDLGYSIGILGPRIAKNALQNHGQEVLKKVVGPQLDDLAKKAPPAVQNQINDLKKKFGF